MQKPSAASDPTPDEVVAAAIAASAWIRRRRAIWAADGPALPPVRVAVPIVQSPQIAAVPVESRVVPAPAVADIEPVKTRRGVTVAQARSVARRLIDVGIAWWKPLAATIAIAAVLAGGAWGARAGWHYMTVTLRTGTATFDSVPQGSGVTVDGIVLGQTPVTSRLSVGRHTIEFHTRKATRVVMLDVSARRQNVARVDWTATPMGHLHAESSPDGAHVLVDGAERGVTPLTIDVAVGAHTVVLRNESGSVQKNVTIANDKTTDVSEGIYAGFLHVASTIALTVSEGSRVYAQDERNQALLPAGPHVLQLRNRDLGFSATRRVDIVPGDVFNLEVNPASSLTVTSTLAAHVMIDGTDVGETPLTNYAVTLGTRDVVVRANTGVERRASLKVTTAPARLDVDFSNP